MSVVEPAKTFPITTGDVDQWAWVKIGEPFPENPVRVKGEMNQYVALWYKNGKPVMGRAWNNGGVVECSFPYSGRELTGARDLGGQIQILTYKGDFAKNKFYYQWVQWKERNQDHLAMVRCGQATAMLMKVKSGNNLVGNMDLTSETATVAENGKGESVAGGANATNLVVVRNHIDPGRKCGIPHKENFWRDIRIHDDLPESSVMAGGKKIDTGDGKMVEHYVALWYKNGEPVFGRAWTYKGNTVEASFGILGKEFTGAIGSIQTLSYFSDFPKDHGFAINWVPYKDCVGGTKEWKPVQVKDVAPCLIKTNKGHEKLGCCWMLQGKASTGAGGLEEIYVGACVNDFLVLCRKDL